MSEFKERPDWWPPNPYPESVFTMTTDEYVEAIPDDKLRTAISGYMSRYGWQVADHDTYAQVEEQTIVPLEEAHKRIKALEGVVEAYRECEHLLADWNDGGEYCCVECDWRVDTQVIYHAEDCCVGKLDKALKKLEGV